MNGGRQVHLKSSEELAAMREAGRVNAEILGTIRGLVAPGVSTADLNAAADEILSKADPAVLAQSST